MEPKWKNFGSKESEVRTWVTGLQGAQTGRAKRQKDSSELRAEGEAKRPRMLVEESWKARPSIGG